VPEFFYIAQHPWHNEPVEPSNDWPKHMRKHERPSPGSDREIQDAKKMEADKSGGFDEASKAEGLGTVELRVSKEIARQAAMTKEQIAQAFERVYRQQEEFGEEMSADKEAGPHLGKFLAFLGTVRQERPE